jgi:thiamine-phosphate pyrophosphorylase
VSAAFDPRLTLITDRRWAGGRPLSDIVAAAVRGGVTAVQLRDKGAPTAEIAAEAERLKTVLAGRGVRLIINDDVAAARAAGADGVHLGQKDDSPAAARRMLGPRAIIGLSVESPDQAAAAEGESVDYLGVSPVFSTPTKTDAGPAWGLAGLRALRGQTRRPLVAVGGIHAGNAAAVLEAGADGLAVVSAIMAAADPEAAARELRRTIDRVRRR